MCVSSGNYDFVGTETLNTVTSWGLVVLWGRNKLGKPQGKRY